MPSGVTNSVWETRMVSLTSGAPGMDDASEPDLVLSPSDARGPQSRLCQGLLDREYKLGMLPGVSRKEASVPYSSELRADRAVGAEPAGQAVPVGPPPPGLWIREIKAMG